MSTPSIAAWVACDSYAHNGNALSARGLKSAALVAPMTPPVALPQRVVLTALATTQEQVELATARPSSRQSTTTYSVRFGDCLSDIATSHNIADWQQLYAVNRRGIANPDLIYPGQLLRLPTTPNP
jgi:nucleoid-associated protein YgaU